MFPGPFHVYSFLSGCWNHVLAMITYFSWQNCISRSPLSSLRPKPCIPTIFWYLSSPTFAFKSPIMHITSSDFAYLIPLTYLPLEQEPLPCSCYLDPSQGSQLHHHFSFIYCMTTYVYGGGPIPSMVTGHKYDSVKTVPVMCHTPYCYAF